MPLPQSSRHSSTGAVQGTPNTADHEGEPSPCPWDPFTLLPFRATAGPHSHKAQDVGEGRAAREGQGSDLLGPITTHLLTPSQLRFTT